MNTSKMIKGIQQREEKALVAFVDQYGPVMKGVIVKTVPGFSYLWGEILNDSTLAVWEDIERYDQTRGSFQSFVARVAKYKAIDALRKEVRHSHPPLEAELVGAAGTEEMGVVEEVLSYLSEEDQRIFRLLFVDGYDYDEVAEMTGLKKGTLYTRVSRGRETLRDKVKEEYHETL